MTAKAKAVFDADTSALSAKLDQARKKTKGIGDEFKNSIPILNQVTSVAGVVGLAIGAITAATAAWNRELEKGKRLSAEIQNINSIAGIGGTIPQSADFRSAIDANLGLGTLGRQQLTEVGGLFKGEARKATAAEFGQALTNLQTASRAQFSGQEMSEIARGMGVLRRAGFSVDDAANMAAMIVRQSGAQSAEVIDAISEIASLAGKEEALALLPYFLGAGDKAVVSTYTSEAAQLAEKGMRSGIASMVPFTDEVRKNAQQYQGMSFSGFLKGQADLAEQDKVVETLNSIQMAEGYAQQQGEGSQAMMMSSLEDRLQEAMKERILNEEGSTIGRWGAQTAFAGGLENVLIGQGEVENLRSILIKTFNAHNKKGDGAPIPVELITPPSLKPNGQE